ncbi:MAG: AMP-binding protein [Clostridia bacterium]|nr:AMP-binding protein [Clostridia bacterium]
MIKNEYKSLRINNIFHDEDSLRRIIEQKFEDTSIASWEKDIYAFIQSWISDQDFIEVNTSGSTGTPKLIRLYKSVLINSAIYTAEALSFKENENALLCLPAKYIAGKMMIIRAFVNNMNLIIKEPSSNPLSDNHFNIDFAAMIPLQVSNILKSKDVGKLKMVRNLIIGGGAIDPNIEKALKDFPNNVYATYGMTETATHIALKKLNSTAKHNYYHCLFGITVRKGSDQCLIINAPHISPEEIKTNDLANIYSDTQFEIIGRKDNIINTGGIKIIPEVLESKIKQFINYNLFVSSLPDQELGEKLILVIENSVKDLNCLYTLWKNLEANLEKHEVPKRIEYLDSFIYTGNGKINRRECMEMLKS